MNPVNFDARRICGPGFFSKTNPKHDAAYRTAPEIEKMTAPVTCIYGSDEVDSGCRLLKGQRITEEVVGKGHHFGGDYERLVVSILQSIHDPDFSR